MSLSVIIGSKKLVREILEAGPLLKNPKVLYDELGKDISVLDDKIRRLQYDHGKAKLDEANEMRKQLAQLVPEYDLKMDQRTKLNTHLETVDDNKKFKEHQKNGGIEVSTADTWTSADRYGQAQQLRGEEFTIKFYCGHTRKFNIYDYLTLTALRMLVSGRCEVELELINCGHKDCKGNTLCLFIRRIA